MNSTRLLSLGSLGYSLSPRSEAGGGGCSRDTGAAAAGKRPLAPWKAKWSKLGPHSRTPLVRPADLRPRYLAGRPPDPDPQLAPRGTRAPPSKVTFSQLCTIPSACVPRAGLQLSGADAHTNPRSSGQGQLGRATHTCVSTCPAEVWGALACLCRTSPPPAPLVSSRVPVDSSRSLAALPPDSLQVAQLTTGSAGWENKRVRARPVTSLPPASGPVPLPEA